MTTPSFLDSLLGQSELHDAIAGQVASALIGRLDMASATPPIRAGVASAAGPIAAASAKPVIAAASPVPSGAGVVSSAAVEAFASAVAARLGFAPGGGQEGVLSAFAGRVASALRGVSEFSAHPEIASSIAGVVASRVGARILASPAGNDFLARQLTGVASATAPLTRRSSTDT